ncbi:unnamed protein product [Cylindrotheca closterium]|uniref:Uncharacterized protein n=1 Tax=Cylindrotheca closterium TaxID=2856 RepID=A0AAD2G9M0_9STRA|nr:unnamed protein product [Cylindrotheca closterium]
MRVRGNITRRRCIGKHLAFADIKVDGGDEVLKIVFQRDSDAWNSEYDDTFPTKNSKLPYDAVVSVDLCDKDETTEERNNGALQVKSWLLLSNPREEALRLAKHKEGGISCSDYLKVRGTAYLKYNSHQSGDNPENSKKKANSDLEGKQESKQTDNGEKLTQDNPNPNDAFSHGDNRSKSMRAKLFAAWLLKTYDVEELKKGTGVLDVAGGKGKLSIELSLQGMIPCTIVDPLVRKHGKKLDPRVAKRIRMASAPHPELISREFNTTSFVQDYERLVQDASMLVGIHPDEPTEDILDLALKFEKPVAIVPCCVFPGLFPLRTLNSGKGVQTYEQFLEYLLAKDGRLRIEKLPFEGRNQIIYLAT